MPVQRISDMNRPSASRTAAVKKTAGDKLVAAVRTRTAAIAQLDATASRLVRAFSDTKRTFTLAQVEKVAKALPVLARQTEAALADARSHFATAIALDLPTTKLASQCDDLATVANKLALLQSVVTASKRAADGDTVDVDDSGYVVSSDDGDDFLDTLPGADTASKKAADNPDPNPSLDDTVIPVGGVSASRKKADGTGFTTTPSQEKPAGVPEPEAVKQNSGDPAAPTISGHGDTSVTLESTPDKPAGVPSPDGNGGAESPSYSKEDPSTSEPSTTLARARITKADAAVPTPANPTVGDPAGGTTAAGDDQMAPAVPAVPPAPPTPPAAPTSADGDLADPLDVVADDDALTDPSLLDPTMADGDLADPAATPGFDELADDGSDGMNLELPDQGFDDMLQDEILSSGEFPDVADPAAPAAPAPTEDATAKAAIRKARLATAARAPGATHVAAETDALKLMILDELR